MLRPLLIGFITIAFFGAKAQEKDISSIENNLKHRVQVVDAPPKTFTINQKMEEYKVPGVSIAIARDGKLVYAKGFGTAISKSGTEVGVNTLFQAGSISKPLAALAALKLVDEGKIDLDADVNDYLKTWKVPENKYTQKEKVTLRRLLTHTAGFTVHGFPGYKPKDDFPTTIDVLEGKGNTDVVTLDTIPGRRWRYSGGGYTIVQLLVKDVSGMELAEYMDKHIFPVIGMSNSTFQQPIDPAKANQVSGAYDRKGKLIKGVWHNYPEVAAAGLWTTPSDLIKYCLHIQNIRDGKIEGVLSKAMVDEMLKPHENDWGLGPYMLGKGDELRFGHGGKNAGFTNDMAAFFNRGDAIVVMTNGDNGLKMIDVVYRAVSDFYGWNIKDKMEVKPVEVGEEELTKYTGKYKYTFNGKSYVITSKVKKGQLVLKDPLTENPVLLTPLSATDFIDIEQAITVDFKSDEKGTLRGLVWNKKWKIEKVK